MTTSSSIDPPNSLSTKSKLPIKRKTPETTTTTIHGGTTTNNDDPRPPPFKFHRIWTEPDEIRFLQGLLDCALEKLSFPRDLNVFYSRFSNTMSQPYTKSQLSEKLRRLRKKFRVISARLSKGLDPSLLSTHDSSLYYLSKRLWHPDFATNSPFSNSNVNSVDHNNHRNGNNRDSSDKLGNSSCLFGVKVSFSPHLPGLDQVNPRLINRDGYGVEEEVEIDGVEVKLSEVNVEFEEEHEEIITQNGHVEEDEDEENVNGIGEVAAKAVINVFNEALEEVRMGIVGKKINGGLDEFEKRCEELRVEELDVFARRLRLILENSLPKSVSI